MFEKILVAVSVISLGRKTSAHVFHASSFIALDLAALPFRELT